MSSWRYVAVVATAAALLQCSAAPSASPRYSFFNSSATGNWPLLTERFILLADNQTQHLYGKPIWLRAGAAPKFLSAAVRPLQLDLYGQDLLKEVVTKQRGNKMPMIHLGDALNFSCQVEMTRFFGLMEDATQPAAGYERTTWVLAPGNHDGYFFGNEGRSDSWSDACTNGGGPVTHADFIRRYLAELAGQFPWLGDLNADSGIRVEPAVPPDNGSFVQGVAWHLDSAKPWLSYVVQLVDMTAKQYGGVPPNTQTVFGLLFDTSEYDDSPVLISQSARLATARLPAAPAQYDAGETGNIRADQVAAARTLLETAVSRTALKPFVVLMGHHPFNALTESAQSAIEEIRHDYFVPIYVSAHTHHAQYFVNETGPFNWLELNLGSVLDWQPEFRDFALSRNTDTGFVEVQTKQYQLDQTWHLNSDPDWEAKQDGKRYYLSNLEVSTLCPSLTHALCDDKMQDVLMQVELNEFLYSIEEFPTLSSDAWPVEDGVALTSDAHVIAAIHELLKPGSDLRRVTLFAQQLQRFDENRNASPHNGKTHADYRLQQALWASQRMHAKARFPEANQTYFILPVEPTTP